jgi:hypothetical protein
MKWVVFMQIKFDCMEPPRGEAVLIQQGFVKI